MHHRFIALLLAGTAPLFCATPVVAQMAPAPSTDADELAAQMRQLAANPQDLGALVRAGELALRLDDATAAAGFFARAERIDPRNARVKAGLGSLLVGEERPGEALRRFAEAEALGADARAFAADRGLAYDLIGEQERAQRDYRLALRSGSNDETVRRYALSLGISGKRDEAYAVLEPLLRRSDRGAWRSRAFILAMSGDPVGANHIATSMLPPGMAQGLQPFFDRLPTLPAADRAFAVHFGEVRATPQRIADARLVPPLPVLGPDPYAPRAVAVATSAPAVASTARDDRRKGRRRKGAPVDVAAAVAPPAPPPLPAPPAYVASSVAEDEQLAPAASSLPARPADGQAIVQPLPATTVVTTPTRRPPVSFTASSAARPTPVTPTPAATVTRPPVAMAANETRLPTRAGPPNDTTVPSQDSSSDGDEPVAPATGARPASPSLPVEVATVPQPVAVSPQPVVTSPPPQPAAVASQSAASAPPSAPVVHRPAPAVNRPAAKPVRSEDSILASIIAGIKVPGSEMAAAPPARKSAHAPAAPAEESATESTPAVKPGTKPTDAKAAAAKKAAAAAAAAKRAADEKRRNDPKLLEPARIWVQVAGGANEAALVLSWNIMKSRAPAAFKGKQGWTTPLRATNRVLAGPFKTDEEARAFVNLLAKSGVQAFTFTSEAGQKITKLPVK